MNNQIPDFLYPELLSTVKIQISDHDPGEVVPAFQKLIQMEFTSEEAYRILVLFLLEAMSANAEDDTVSSLQRYRNELRLIAKGYYSCQDLKEQMEQVFADAPDEEEALTSVMLDEFEEKEFLEPEDRADLLVSEGEGLQRPGSLREAEANLVRVPYAEDDPELAESPLKSAEKPDVPGETMDFLEEVSENASDEDDDPGLSEMFIRSLVNHSILTLKDTLLGELKAHPVPEAEEALKDFRERGFSEEQSRLLICMGLLIRAQQRMDLIAPMEGSDLMTDLPQAMNALMGLGDGELDELLEQMSFSGLSEKALILEHLLMLNKNEEAVSYYEAHEKEFFAELNDYIQEEQTDYEQLCEESARKGIFFDEMIYALLEALSDQDQEEAALELLEQLRHTIEITDPDNQDLFMRYEILLNDELDQTERADHMLEKWQKKRMNCMVQRTILDLLMRRNQKMDASQTADEFLEGPIADDDLSAGDLLKSIRKVYLAVDNQKLARAAEKKYLELGYAEEDLEDDPEFRFYN